jgi:hypothetical protein
MVNFRYAEPCFFLVQPNPFGAARPREQVIAEREGKKETEVLKEQAHKEWKPNVRKLSIFYFCFVVK